MPDIIPPWQFAPNEVPWARWVQERIIKLSRDAELAAQRAGNDSSAQQGTIQVLGQLIAALRGDVENAFANIRIDMSQVPTGDLPQERVTGTWTKGVTTGDPVSTSGALTGDAGLTSVGAANFDVTTLPGGRDALWINTATGRIGQTSSTLRKKTNLRPVEYTAEQFLAVAPTLYEYLAQLAIRDDPENPNYDPQYVVPTDVGVIAEHLIEAGLDAFVIFDGEGLPANVDYGRFAAIGLLVIGRSAEERMERLRERVAEIEEQAA